VMVVGKGAEGGGIVGRDSDYCETCRCVSEDFLYPQKHKIFPWLNALS
jgi:hypothetical protein